MDVARLLVPAIRADRVGEFDWVPIQRAIEQGVGGFIVFGGEAAEVAELTQRIRSAFSRRLIIGSDLERGAGQQFAGATRLPPAAAIGSLGSTSVTRRAGLVTGREAAALGIDLVFAPVADLDIEPRNPIVGTRSFGADANTVASNVSAWIEGCHEGGSLACVKHFPGHGRTIDDSHLQSTAVDTDRSALAQDLLPFRAAVSAGVDSVMTAHVAYPALDPAGAIATLSAPIIGDLLRGSLGFPGIVVSDAVNMVGMSGGLGEGEASVRALAAGCDLLLYPGDVALVVESLKRAVEEGRLVVERLRESVRRVESALATPRQLPALGWGSSEDQRWALEIAVGAIRVLRGAPTVVKQVELTEIDDDLGGPHPPPRRDKFAETLADLGLTGGTGSGSKVLAIYSEGRAWKGRAGLSQEAVRRANQICEAAREAIVVLFGHPRLADQLPSARHVLCAWGGELLMQQAAGHWLATHFEV